MTHPVGGGSGGYSAETPLTCLLPSRQVHPPTSMWHLRGSGGRCYHAHVGDPAGAHHVLARLYPQRLPLAPGCMLPPSMAVCSGRPKVSKGETGSCRKSCPRLQDKFQPYLQGSQAQTGKASLHAVGSRRDPSWVCPSRSPWGGQRDPPVWLMTWKSPRLSFPGKCSPASFMRHSSRPFQQRPQCGRQYLCSPARLEFSPHGPASHGAEAVLVALSRRRASQSVLPRLKGLRNNMAK